MQIRKHTSRSSASSSSVAPFAWVLTGGAFNDLDDRGRMVGRLLDGELDGIWKEVGMTLPSLFQLRVYEE
jgi:hypothetical protein